ncbi:MAG TPA: glycosyltransferase [Solirubrobacteraceae bacterium]|nr:glycosyltransferase [Solirubrobacteraceae bacterium]
MSGSTPRVTVVMPAFNVARTITEAMASVLSQTMDDLELLVVDDGSTDETATTALSVQDPRVRVIRRENGGTSAARNTGIEQAQGDWVAFLDADDVWLPRKLEIQLALMAQAPGCLASQGSAYLVDDDLRQLALRHCVPVENPLLTFLRFENLPNAGSSWIVERTLLEKIGGFDTTLPRIEDWEFSIRLARFAQPLCIDEPLALYRYHDGNRSHDIDAHVDAGLVILDRLFADPTLPAEIRSHRREVYARFYNMLCGGMFRTRNWPGCVYWGTRALVTDPRVVGYMMLTPIRRLKRRAEVRQSDR